MSLQLENVSRAVDGVDFIRDADLTFEAGSFNVLLGRTLAGKTSLMRLMAGLDQPDSGRILHNSEDVTGQGVRKRNVSMVYQQFINYPNLTVYENIASPLRLAKMKEQELDRRVKETAAMLHIDNLLSRYPLELSGGQQQRTAMARALVKDATLILFDEPLVNLDYKLREELRSELRQLFRERQCIAVYATTEANEALALGGTTTLLHEGRVVQTGPVAEVYRRPVNTLAAELFSEPPMNLLPGKVTGNSVTFGATTTSPVNWVIWQKVTTFSAFAPVMWAYLRRGRMTWRWKWKWNWRKSVARKPSSTWVPGCWTWWSRSWVCIHVTREGR